MFLKVDCMGLRPFAFAQNRLCFTPRNDILGQLVEKLLESQRGRFSRKLGIDIESKDSKEIFKWFLASTLFGARITETIAVNTYHEFESNKVIDPSKIVGVGWDGLVKILDTGGYVRYDFKTATKLLNVCETLLSDYKGDLNELHKSSVNYADLKNRLEGLGKGIGDVTVNIFLRELRGIWELAEPLPQNFVILGARNLGLTKPTGKNKSEREKMLYELKAIWKDARVRNYTFSDFEVSLLKLAKNFCNKKKCKLCAMQKYCQKFR